MSSMPSTTEPTPSRRMRWQPAEDADVTAPGTAPTPLPRSAACAADNVSAAPRTHSAVGASSPSTATDTGHPSSPESALAHRSPQ